jgi:hypothetical protein
MLSEALAQYEQEHEFARQILLPEEERLALPTSIPWQGGYRWFQSANVVCLEKYRRLRVQGRV